MASRWSSWSRRRRRTRSPGYLGSGYVVEASVGHIRDLPRNAADVPAEHKGAAWARLGVDVDNSFEPLYVVSPDRRQQVSRLKQLVKDASEVYLATDEDREGEAIAWHLVDTLKPRVPVHRMVFHEITPEAIARAVANPRELDTALVDAQETRRILDRLYGYEVSPVLWKKVLPKLSAGRVQSVATRIVVERERERMAFHAADYWSLEGTFAVPRQGAATDEGEPTTVRAKLVSVDDSRVATGKDFDPATGRVTGEVVHLDEAGARGLAARLEGRQVTVSRVDEKPYRRRPYAPFTTSTLQMDAGRKLGWSSAQTMRVAQRLYENGHITYMRTDSTNLSQEAINAARSQARELYGDAYVPAEARRYKSKAKGAQEAHEAIRPAGDNFRTPGPAGPAARPRRVPALRADLAAHRRLADGRRRRADGQHPAGRAQRHRRGRRVHRQRPHDHLPRLPQGLRRVAGRGGPANGDDEPSSDDAERRLPRLERGQQLDTQQLDAKGHTTSPPSRYTEPSLVARLEELGIGRPSTYASIMQTIQDRGYVWKKGNSLVPSFIAFAVVNLLEQHFAQLVDYDFTASLEEELDEIAGGNLQRVDWLTEFYFGGEGRGTRRHRRVRRPQADRRPAPGGDRRPRRQLHPAAGDRSRRRGRRRPGRPLRARTCRPVARTGRGSASPRTSRPTSSPARRSSSCWRRPPATASSAPTRSPATPSSSRPAATARTSPPSSPRAARTPRGRRASSPRCRRRR